MADDIDGLIRRLQAGDATERVDAAERLCRAGPAAVGAAVTLVRACGTLLVNGAHLAVRSVAMYTVWNVTTVIAAHLDEPTLAANQVAMQLFMFLALVLDALAVPLLGARGFVAEDFARSHPGGALGRRLLTHVRDLMRQGDAVPVVGTAASMSAMLREMSAKGLGFTAVVSEDGQPVGIFTDGDLRRLIERGVDLLALQAQDVMHRGPKLVREDALAVDAAGLMEQHRITSVIVVDAGGRITGALNSNDLMRAKVI